jgi:hypothetical protein
MNVRLGIYEIFSRIVPGGFYLAAIYQFLVVLGLVSFDWQSINNISLIPSIGLVIIAYILGEALDRFSVVWFRIFKKRGLSGRVLAEFRQSHKDRWNLDITDDEWPVMLAYIRTKNLELAGEIERHNALSIMLRNVSFGLLLMTVSSVILLFQVRNLNNLLLAIVLLLLSILIGREAVKFRRWFYESIFQTTLAYRIDLENRIKPIQTAPKRTKEKKMSDVDV